MSNEQVSKVVQTVKTVADIKSHVATIHAVMDSVMKAGTHYDTIKGCGDKPVLLKAGAESAQVLKLNMLGVPLYVMKSLKRLPTICAGYIIKRVGTINHQHALSR